MPAAAANPLRRAVFAVKSSPSNISTWNLLVDRFIRGSPRAEDQVVSIVVWKVLRLLPKPIVFILMFFLLGAVAKA